MTEILILIAVGFALYGGHKFNWTVIPGATDGDGRLEPLIAYVFGVSCILAGLAVWCYADGGDFTWFYRAFVVSVAAGTGTWLGRVDENRAEHQALEKDIQDYGAAE